MTRDVRYYIILATRGLRNQILLLGTSWKDVLKILPVTFTMDRTYPSISLPSWCISVVEPELWKYIWRLCNSCSRQYSPCYLYTRSKLCNTKPVLSLLLSLSHGLFYPRLFRNYMAEQTLGLIWYSCPYALSSEQYTQMNESKMCFLKAAWALTLILLLQWLEVCVLSAYVAQLTYWSFSYRIHIYIYK